MIDILVVAAGESRRFGSTKQLACIDGVPMLRRSVLTAVATNHRVTVVLGAQFPAVAACVAELGVTVVENDRWSTGMGSSIAVGAAAIGLRRPRCQAVLVTLADQPLVGIDDLRRMIDAHLAWPERILAADHGNGVIGAPALFPALFLRELSILDGDHGARSLLQQHAAAVTTVPMPSAAVDIDTPGDLGRLLADPANGLR